MSRGGQNRRIDYVVEDVRFLLGTDSPENIARRLGYKNVEALRRVLWRAGEPELAARLHVPKERTPQWSRFSSHYA